jgi:cyclopropane-fatty-acyl-phospholipid synthase
MGEMGMRKIVEEILSPAGITLNGDRPWDIRINNELFYHRVLGAGSLGLGESYMDGWWECEQLDEFFNRLMKIQPEEKIRKNLKLAFHGIRAAVFNLGSRSHAFEVGEKHYDLGNDLYRSMLDRRMIYSCAYWEEANNLDDAQEAKLDLICRKIGLTHGDRVLDIGCGWGGFAGYAAKKYGAEVVGITVSTEQTVLGRELCRDLPVEIRLCDYRDVNEKFDHIISVGMFEHVGYKNYRTYMEVAGRCLKDDGLFLLHTIGSTTSSFTVDPWFGKYIFPNSMLPSLKQIAAVAEKLFVIEDIHNFGYFYDSTLTAWFDNFSRNWDRLRERYDERFYRMWKYYLLSSAGSFRCRDLQVWQIVFSKKGVARGYSVAR